MNERRRHDGQVLRGLVQDDHPLTLRHALERMRRVYAAAEVVTLGPDAEVHRTSYGDLCERVDRLCAALQALGVAPGDRVASFAWNSQHHLELYLAVPCMGAVLHTLNIRLFAEQVSYIANHAEDQVVFVDASLVPVLERIAPTLRTVRHYVVMGDHEGDALPDALRYEELLSAHPPGFRYPELDDRMAAGLCYTSGTTGDPKGVLTSHRSSLLHAAGACMTDSIGVGSGDRVMPVVPMFHANAWGLPYAAALTGADLVMPGPFLQAEPLAGLIEDEQVTIAGAVPTIWLDLLHFADEHAPDLSSLRTVICGGAAVPRALMEQFEDRHGVRILQAWGMTEMSPLGSIARPPADAPEDEAWAYRDCAGRILPLVEARLVDEEGREVPWDGESTGELQVRGPWIASAYYRSPDGAARFDAGWLRTGDIAAIDGAGYISITDRAKDVIKSGGEWISSVALENALMAHPDVAEAAVIGCPDERWTERPLACVVLRKDAEAAVDALRDHLAGRVASWWVPQAYAFIAEVPKTSVGKFDKKALRRQLAEGRLDVVSAAAA